MGSRGSRGSRRSNLQAQKCNKNARVCIRRHCPEWDGVHSSVVIVSILYNRIYDILVFEFSTDTL
jgi:hypothetical protein